MTVNQQISAIIATFTDHRHAEQFVAELKRAGFADDEIGILSPTSAKEGIEEDTLAGGITGGMLGAVAGAVATGLIPGVGPVLATGLLTGIVGGAATGGLLGALVGLGIHEEKARHHEQQLASGKTLVAVQAVARGWEALEILRRCEESLGLRVPPTEQESREGPAGGFFQERRRRALQRARDNYRKEGETYLAHGDYDKAIADFTEAIRLDSTNVAAYLDRGLAYEEQGQYQEAISDFDLALRHAPNHALAHLYRGNCWLALDDFDQAIHDYTQAIQLQPDLALAYYYRGLAHTQTGDAPQARADRAKAILLDPSLSEL